MYFRAIDGLRAYLAWVVVAAHVTWYTGLTERTPALGIVNRLADNAVILFIIISGFVITHLLLTRREGYLVYLDRRILRLFPSYLVCLAFGTFTTFLYFNAFAGHPWGDLTPHMREMSDQIASLEGRGLFYHLLAHVWLLNGIIPDSVLYQAQMMFLAPAWSLSLEWQFYLIAPLAVAAMSFAGGRIAACIVAGAAFIAYSKGWFGSFDHPSFLPGAAIFFAIGAVTRIAINELPKVTSYPLGLGMICLAATYNVEQLRPLVLWGAFVAWWALRPRTILRRGSRRRARKRSRAAW